MTTRKRLPRPDDTSAPATPSHWVQTGRAEHEAWAQLTVRHPKAGALLHVLAARAGAHNAVVVSQKTLAGIIGCHVNTVAAAVKILEAGNWIEVRQLGASATVNAYVLNDRVVWHTARDGLKRSLFSATVVAALDEQPDADLIGAQPPLRKLPRSMPGEQQLPSGPGEPPPSQMLLDGLEPDLPAIGQGDE